MNPDIPHDVALGRVQRALEMFNHPVFKSAFGDIEGVDMLSIAVDRMTDALAALAGCPRTEDTTLESVMAALSPGNTLDPQTNKCLLHVREGMKQATYGGVSETQISELDRARIDLKTRLQALVDAQNSRGNG